MSDADAVVDPLSAFAAPAAETPRPRAEAESVLEAWGACRRDLAALLGGDEPDAAWREAFEAAAGRLRGLAAQDPDAALYVLMHHCSVEVDRYSAHHGMRCAVIAEICAASLGWDEPRIDAVVRAALTMNLSMAALQDTLARQMAAVTSKQREAIGGHAERSVAMLAAAGVTDALWTDVVRHHHGDAPDGSPAAEPARLLQRIDVYAAKLSRRASRAAVSPALAARDACLGQGGRPDQTGATILRCLGLYPPGCFVRLVNGDVGIVVRRGARAHTPIVAALRRPDEGLHSPPVRRDTSDTRFAVQHGMPPDSVRVHLNHPRVLATA